MTLTSRYLIRVILGGLFFSAAPGHLPAQPQPPAEQAGTFRLVSLGPAEPFLYDFDQTSTRTVRPAVSTYSKPQPIPPDGKLRFYRLGEIIDPNLPPPRIPVADISVPIDEPKPLIIILIPVGRAGLSAPKLADGQPAEFSTLILDDSPAVSPKEHLRIVSFSKRPARVQLGGTTIQLGLLESKHIPYPAGDRVSIEVSTYADEQWTPIVSSTQMLSPNTRLTLLLSDLADFPGRTQSSELILRKIVDLSPPPPSSDQR